MSWNRMSAAPGLRQLRNLAEAGHKYFKVQGPSDKINPQLL